MDIIIMILIALGCLNSKTDYTTEYEYTHQAEISHAKSIYDAKQYHYDEGGIVIDEDVNPVSNH